MNADGTFDDSFSISGYWAQKTATWPKLAEVARHLLAVASSAICKHFT